MILGKLPPPRKFSLENLPQEKKPSEKLSSPFLPENWCPKIILWILFVPSFIFIETFDRKLQLFLSIHFDFSQQFVH